MSRPVFVAVNLMLVSILAWQVYAASGWWKLWPAAWLVAYPFTSYFAYKAGMKR